MSGWDKDGLSLPKKILPKSSSSISGSFVLVKSVIEHLIVLEAADIYKIPWQTWRVSREWLIL